MEDQHLLGREILGDNNGAGVHEFRNNVRTAYAGKGDTDFWQKHVQNDYMRQFMKDAYDSKDGYAIKRNPTTGLDEMFVAGTHSPITKKGVKEWFQNVGEGVEHLVGMDKQDFNLFSKHREEFALKLEEQARENNVQVVYGHSRGAAIMSDFHDRDFIFIGLDGATGITQHHSDIINIEHKGDLFDFAIAAHGKSSRNIHVPGKFHNVTEKRKSKKSKKSKYRNIAIAKYSKKEQVKAKKIKKKKEGRNDIISPPKIKKKRGFLEGPAEARKPKTKKKKEGGRGKKRKIESPPEIFRSSKFFK